MGRIDAQDVGTGLEQRRDRRLLAGRRPDGGDDFRAADLRGAVRVVIDKCTRCEGCGKLGSLERVAAAP